MDTLTVLLPYLTVLASTAGAGAAASDLFTLARTRLAGVALPPWAAWLLISRIGARLSVMALAALISLAATSLVSAISGAPLGPALDSALAAIIVSQLYHLKEMRGQLAAQLALIAPADAAPAAELPATQAPTAAVPRADVRAVGPFIGSTVDRTDSPTPAVAIPTDTDRAL